MEIEIIAIGNEILSGFITNSNAAFIGQQLLNAGLRTTRHSVLPDDPVRLRQGLIEALSRSQLVITTGGLGSTCDDNSREIAAEIFQSDFRFDDSISDDLIKRYGPDFPTIKNQSTVPSKAIILRNAVGTAPGFIFRNSKSTLIMLPGIPEEMKTMWQNGALPFIRENFAKTKKNYIKRLHLFDTSEAVVDKEIRPLIEKHPNVEFGIYPGFGALSVQFSAFADNEAEALKLIDPPFNAIKTHFAQVLFEAPSGKIEEAVHLHFVRKGYTLSAAESCTGGRLASMLTAIPGASQYFLGSIVAYSNSFKTDFLGVPDELLQEKGAVSEDVVREMLSGLLQRTKSDFGVAITGIAGPDGGTPEKPVGTVWCAVGHRSGIVQAWMFKARGNREMVINRSVNVVLSRLLQLTYKI